MHDNLSRRMLIALGGLGLLVISAILAWDQSVPSLELDAFEVVNGWPEWLAGPGWPIMQFGMVISPIVAAGIAGIVTRGRHPALGLLGGGIGVWLVAKVVKEIVTRPRPGGLLDVVLYRLDGGPDGLGFVSGHAAVAFAIAVILTPYVKRRWAILLFAVAVAAATLRVFVGAHLPLDSVGGAGLGLAIGSLVPVIRVRR